MTRRDHAARRDRALRGARIATSLMAVATAGSMLLTAQLLGNADPAQAATQPGTHSSVGTHTTTSSALADAEAGGQAR